MGCNCKNVEKLEKVLPFKNDYERKGIWKVINGFSINVLNKAFTILLFIIMTPIVIITLILSYLIKYKLILHLPKFIAKLLKEKRQDE